MKKTLSILTLSLLPMVALAAGSHGGGHGAAAQGMPDHHDMSAMPHAASPSGRPGDPAQVTRTVEIDMLDTMRFAPSEIQASAGETLRFLIRNSGKLPHEMVIGPLADLKAHAVEMRKQPGMRHAEPNAIMLEPGQHGSLVWTFDQAGTVDFACTIPGHMEGGMIGKVTVD